MAKPDVTATNRLTAAIKNLELRVARLEAGFPTRHVPQGLWMDLDWDYFPPLLTVGHLSAIYGRTVNGIRKGLQQRSPKLPTPCLSRPFMVRRSDCKRHFARMSA